MTRELLKQALEALQLCANGEDDVLLTREALSALRQALEQPTVKDCLKVEPKQEQEPYGWKVQGVALVFTGEYAEQEAKAAAKRMGGTCQAFPLYVRPPPLAVERERNFCERCGRRLGGADHIHTCTPPQPAPQAAIEQEPVAWISGKSLAEIKDFDATVYGRGGFDDATPIYTEPPKREWKGLTDEEIAQGNKESWITQQAFESAVWWAEQKLKEKNT